MEGEFEDGDVEARERELAQLRARIQDAVAMLSTRGDVALHAPGGRVVWSAYLAGLFWGIPVWFFAVWLLLAVFG